MNNSEISLEKLKNSIKALNTSDDNIQEKLEKLTNELNDFIDESNILLEFGLTRNQLETMTDDEFDRFYNKKALLKERKEKLKNINNDTI